MITGYILALMAGAAGLAFGVGYISGARNRRRLGSAWADGLGLGLGRRARDDRLRRRHVHRRRRGGAAVGGSAIRVVRIIKR